MKNRIFEFPPKETDYLLVIRNGEWSSDLKLNRKQKNKIDLNWYYNDQHLDVIHQTLTKWNEVLGPIRKNASKWDYIILAYILIGIWITGGFGFILLYYLHYVLSIILGAVFLCGIIYLIWYSKRNAHEVLLSSHIWMSFITSYHNLKYSSDSITHLPWLEKARGSNLSLEFRTELNWDNTNLQLHNKPSWLKLKFLPGYLGKWLEIHNVLPGSEPKLYDDQSAENNL